MPYQYKDDTPVEDMTARDHYIKASLYAEKAAEYANKLAQYDSFSNYIALANVHARLAENDVNGWAELAELE